MPRKEFDAFTRLDASDVNTFLMDQSVMTFASSAARGSAIATPVEGMLTYLEDSNSLQLWTGSQWDSASGVSSGNAIINGAFEINQRGFTSTTTSTNYGHDRWRLITVGGTSTYSSQAFTPGVAPVAGYEGTSFARLATTGQSGVDDQSRIYQRIEDVRTFAGQTVTLSFFAKSASGTPTVSVGLVQNFGSGGSSSVNHAQKVVLSGSTSWTRYSLTFAITNLVGKTIGTNSLLEMNLWTSAGSNLNANTDSLGTQTATIDFWGVQLEEGTVANDFRRNANSLQGELAACQRYAFVGGTGAVGRWGSTTSGEVFLTFPVVMRSAPTVTHLANYSAAVVGVTGLTITNTALASGQTTGASLTLTTGGATLGAFAGINGSPNVLFSSEL